MSDTRYLWGKSKVKIIDFVPIDEPKWPPYKKGRMFCDSDGNFRLWIDSTACDIISVHN